MRRIATMLSLSLSLLVVACERADSTADTASGPDATIAADTALTESTEPAEAATADSLRGALVRLVRGEAPPASAGSFSWFSARTAGVLQSVTVDSAGHATVEFDDLRSLIPNASSSAGSEALLRELNTAVFAVPGIESVEYSMDGSCEAFGEWLQYGECMSFDRAAVEAAATAP